MSSAAVVIGALRVMLKSKRTGNDQEILHSNPTSYPQNQKGIRFCYIEQLRVLPHVHFNLYVLVGALLLHVALGLWSLC